MAAFEKILKTLVMGCLFVAMSVSHAADYYVSPSGSDAASGSLSSPFATIQRGIKAVGPGDRLILRAGTYRESVRPPISGTASLPITLMAFSGEKAVISGCDAVTGFSTSGSLIQAPAAPTFGQGVDQVFVDGQAMLEARWPQPSGDVSRPRLATVSSVTSAALGTGSTVTIKDGNLKQAAGSLVGAKINLQVGDFGINQTGTITANTTGSVTLSTAQPLIYTLKSGAKYFIYGVPSLLDTNGEWAFNSGYLQISPLFKDQIANHAIEIKRRAVGIDLSGRSNFVVYGLTLFACTVTTDANSANNVLDTLQFQYPGSSTRLNNPWTDIDLGVVLAGVNEQLVNSSIAYAAGNGVTVTASQSLVQNCQIHDVAYSAADAAGIAISAVGDKVLQNTIYNSARHGVNHDGATQAKISGNDIYFVALQTIDCGGTYAYHTAGGGTEISYNTIHDCRSPGGGVNSAGIAGVCIDNNCTGMSIHHNLVYRCDYGIHVNSTADTMTLANNTLDPDTYGFFFGGTGGFTNLTVANNIYTKPTMSQVAISIVASVGNSVNPLFVAPPQDNYQLQSSSPAIGIGVPLSPVTDGTGKSIDAGAFQSTLPAWTAGANNGISPAASPVELATSPGLDLVYVRWKAVPGAASYNLYRSLTSQGPYTLIVANTTATSCSDFGASHYTNFYVVEAVNANGTSGRTGECSGTSVYFENLHGLIGEYYFADNPGEVYGGTVYSTPAFRRLDPQINFVWGYTPPDPRLGANNYSVAWTGYITPPTTATYTFTANADNGVRLFVNGNLLFDRFYGWQGTVSGSIQLNANQKYSIRVEYFQITGWAQMQLCWSYPGVATTPIPSWALTPATGGGIEGSYYNDPAGSLGAFGTYVTTRLDSQLSSFWAASPAAGVNGTWWSAKWRGQLLAPVDGTYNIAIKADNCERMWLNGQPLTSRWSNTTGTETAQVQLAGGSLNDLAIDFGNGTGGGGVIAQWGLAGESSETIPAGYLFPPLASTTAGLAGRYFKDGNWSSIAGTRIDSAVNFDWTSQPPLTGMSLTGYSVRWSGRIVAPVDSWYIFYLDGTGSATLTVNGQRLIVQQGTGTFSATGAHSLNLKAGQAYDVRLDYAPGTSPGKLLMSWHYLGQPWTPVPATSFRLNWDLN